jgi:hypothetical protein
MGEFRIVEFSTNRFRIEIKDVEKIKSGYLWWRKTEEIIKWRKIDNKGFYLVHTRFFSNIENEMPEFETFEEAKNKVLELQHIIKYHYL